MLQFGPAHALSNSDLAAALRSPVPIVPFLMSADCSDSFLTSVPVRDWSLTSADCRVPFLTSADCRVPSLTSADCSVPFFTSADFSVPSLTSADFRVPSLMSADVSELSFTSPPVMSLAAPTAASTPVNKNKTTTRTAAARLGNLLDMVDPPCFLNCQAGAGCACPRFVSCDGCNSVCRGTCEPAQVG